MKIELHKPIIKRPERQKPITIEEFADAHNLIMEIHDRGYERGNAGKFYAKFKSSETKLGECLLVGTYGDGATPNAAIKDYARKLQGEVLVIDAMKAARREIVVPLLKIKP